MNFKKITVLQNGTLNYNLTFADVENLEFDLERDAKLVIEFKLLDFHSDFSLNLIINLKYPGAEGFVKGVTVINGNANVKFNMVLNHLAEHTLAKVDIKSVCYDESKFDFAGKIFVSETARFITSALQNKNMLMSKNAKINSVPTLEVLNKEVKCSHGSAVARPDKNAIYYLMSRGLEMCEAEKLLIEAFLK